MAESYLDRVRSNTLGGLKHAKRPAAPPDWKNQPIQLGDTAANVAGKTLYINPDATMSRLRKSYVRNPNALDDAAQLPKQLPRVNNWDLGLKESASNLAGTMIPQSPNAPKLGSGQTLTEAAKETIADQKDLEAHLQQQSYPWDRAQQFLAGVPLNFARYAAAEAGSGGNPIVGATLGGGAADAILGQSGAPGTTSSGDMLRNFGNSAAWGAGFERSAEGGETLFKRPIHWTSKQLGRTADWGLTKLGVDNPHAGAYIERHAPQILEPLVEAARDESTGEGVSDIIPSDQQVQGWVNPFHRPSLPGQAPAVTPQQMGSVSPLRQYLPASDNPSPLPAETAPEPAEADAEKNENQCGRNSRAPCYAQGGSVLDGMRRWTMHGLKNRYADGGAVESDDDLAQDIGEAIEQGPPPSGASGSWNSPGPVHAGNANKITLDPAATQRESQPGPWKSGYQPAPGPWKSGYQPPAAPSREDQLRALYKSLPAPGEQPPAAKQPPVQPPPASGLRSVFDDPLKGHPGYSPWHPLTPLGGALYGLGAAMMGDPEAGASALEPMNVAPAAAQSVLQAITPQNGVTQGIIFPNPADERTMSGGAHATGEQADVRAATVKQLISDMRNRELSPQEQDQFAAARQQSPELDQVGDLMLPLEARQIIKSPQNIQAVQRLLQVIPDSYKLASAAKMGVSKLGWYRGSSQALTDVFGSDAPRFAQLLASMSPQTSVESNLYNALNTWKNWAAEGRPTDPAAIKRIMAKSVQGGADKSALDAWVNNSVRSLSAADPQEVVLSGPKVDSFYHNLRDDVFRVTNDAWMANALGIAQDAFQGQGANLPAGNPGMTPLYAGASARLRDAALKAGMLPSQGQETIWSTAMQLYEMARKNGMHPREVLERGMLTPEIIRGAPDFSTLLKDPKYARILEDAGYGSQLKAMQPFQFPERSVPMSAAEQEQFGHIANILGETARMRGDVSASTKFAMPKSITQPERAFGSVQVEAQPGVAARHFPEAAALPYGSKGTYASGAFSGLADIRGLPSLFSNPRAGIQTTPTENVIGAYTPETTELNPNPTAEVNPARSQGFSAPLTWTAKGPKVETQFMHNLRGPAAVQNVMLAQEGAGIPVMIPNDNGANLSIRLPDKPTVRPEEMQALQQKYGGDNFAFAHTGPRLHVLAIGDQPLTDDMAQDMTNMVRGKNAKRADNVGDYLSFASNWAKNPGSGAVTNQMMDLVDRMTPEARGALDQEMRHSAAKTLDFYQQKIRTQGWTPREDLLNLLTTMRDKGFTGVRKGLKNGAYLPALVGGFLAPHLLQHNDQREQ